MWGPCWWLSWGLVGWDYLFGAGAAGLFLDFKPSRGLFAGHRN